MAKQSRTRPKLPSTRSWCVTSYKTDLDVKQLFESKECYRYIISGKEKCPKTGRDHLQMFFQFKYAKKFGAAKKNLPEGCHLEAMIDTAETSANYCKKDGDWEEYGVMKSQGQRKDFDDMKEFIDAGVKKGTLTELDLWHENYGMMSRYHKSQRRYKFLSERVQYKAFRDVYVMVFYGSTGSGKTKAAMALADWSIHASQLQWWDTYEPSMKCIVIDEFDNQCKITYTLGLMDGHPMRLPVKGGFTWAGWEKVIYTTNLTPDQIHKHAKPKHREALDRRVDEWINFDDVEMSDD